MKPKWIVGAAVFAGGITFGYVGGEYSTADWRTLRQGVEREQRAIVRLEAEIDSLRVEATALENDSTSQERAARERFGMLRPGEILYRVRPGEPPRPPRP